MNYNQGTKNQYLPFHKQTEYPKEILIEYIDKNSQRFINQYMNTYNLSQEKIIFLDNKFIISETNDKYIYTSYVQFSPDESNKYTQANSHMSKRIFAYNDIAVLPFKVSPDNSPFYNSELCVMFVKLLSKHQYNIKKHYSIFSTMYHVHQIKIFTREIETLLNDVYALEKI